MEGGKSEVGRVIRSRGALAVVGVLRLPSDVRKAGSRNASNPTNTKPRESLFSISFLKHEPVYWLNIFQTLGRERFGCSSVYYVISFDYESGHCQIHKTYTRSLWCLQIAM